MTAPVVDARWRASLLQRIDAPPTFPRVPFALLAGARRHVVGSIETDLALRLAGAGVALQDDGDAWCLQVDGSVDGTLDALARTLRELGAASAWRDELLVVEDDYGAVVGAIERAAVRPLGIASHAVHLVVVDGRGGTWVQQRALDKSVDPGKWDTTMGGMVSAGETAVVALERETWEEAGLRMAQLSPPASLGRFTVRRPLPDGYMVEHVQMFHAQAAAGVIPANQDGEVARFECLPYAELLARLQSDAFTLEAAAVLLHWLEQAA